MFTIGICGGVASGKTTLAKKICSLIRSSNLISMDNYFYSFSELSLKERKKINFDNPNVYDYRLIIQHVKKLQNHECIRMPIYSFSNYTRTNKTIKIKPSNILIVEGYASLYDEQLRNLFDYTIFIDIDEQKQLERLIKRDVKERSRSKKDVIAHFYKKIKESNINFVLPQREYAKMVIKAEDVL